MKYPIINKYHPFLGSIEVEMTPQEYEGQIENYRSIMLLLVSTHRGIEYNDYLRRWFGNEECDGLPNFETRYNTHTLPMPRNIYFN